MSVKSEAAAVAAILSATVNTLSQRQAQIMRLRYGITERGTIEPRPVAPKQRKSGSRKGTFTAAAGAAELSEDFLGGEREEENQLAKWLRRREERRKATTALQPLSSMEQQETTFKPMPIKDVAKRLKMSPKTVMALEKKALGHLREALRAGDGGVGATAPVGAAAAGGA